MLNALRTDNSPFNEQELDRLKSSLGSLSPEQSQWLSGYLAGRLAAGDAPAAEAAAPPRPRLSVLYGSETGNGQGVAEDLAGRAEAEGLAVDVQSLDGFRPGGLRKLEHAVFVMSTHGEGDPPEEALDLFEFLDSERAPKLTGLSYRVLALGDRSYSRFCEAGRRLDERLQALGARPFGPRVECDVAYHDDAAQWGDEVIRHARETLGESTANRPATHLSVVHAKPRWDHDRPFAAEVLRVQRLTGPGSSRDVFHVELSLAESGLDYEPGDALGVWAPNDGELVAEILDRLMIAPSDEVTVGGQPMGIAEALADHLEITRLSADTVDAWARRSGNAELETHIASLDEEQRREFIEGRQFADLALEFPGRLDAPALAALLRPLGPRSYSISSSRALVDDEAHLVVSTLESEAAGVRRFGVASRFLNHRVGTGGEVRVFPEPNRRFRLPEDRTAPIVMIGAGTGIAPYRAFLQELEARGDAPETWLIFGNPNLRTDFLYQREFLQWRADGLLGRIDAAWSRDQADKRYVQHVVREEAERLDAWIRRGAHVYLCGGLAMGHAVQEALRDGLAAQRGLDEAAGGELLSGLRRERRLMKDLY